MEIVSTAFWEKETKEDELITSLTDGILMSAQSWKEAKEIAEREGEELVFHNYDTGAYGACSRDRSFGCFVKGEFVEQRCICIPAKYSPEELEKKERDFLSENPGWAD